jgi:hypothetical protein
VLRGPSAADEIAKTIAANFVADGAHLRGNNLLHGVLVTGETGRVNHSGQQIEVHWFPRLRTCLALGTARDRPPMP